MNTDLRKEARSDFEKDIFKLMNNVVFGKTMENIRKHRDIKLVITGKRRIYLVSEPIYHPTKFFREHLLVTEMKKPQILINQPVYLGRSILELSKILIYEFWYDYVNLIYGKKTKLCYMDTDSFIVYIKIDVKIRFDTSNYELDRPLLKEKYKKVIELMKDELRGKIMTKLVGLRGKTYSYLIDDGNEDRKAKATKKCFKKGNLTLTIIKTV